MSHRCSESESPDNGVEPSSEAKKFLGHFVEAMKEQIRGGPAQKK